MDALDAGANDYVTKPFSMNELLARVRAHSAACCSAGRGGDVIEAGDFRIDLESRFVTVRGNEIRSHQRSSILLTYLAQHAGKVVTHRALLAAVWGPNSTEQPEYLRVFVGQLRKKIEADPSNPKYLLTEPWVGYRFEAGK